MHYHDEYERALKYGAAPEPEVTQFVNAHHDHDPNALPVLADLLEDHNDPRGDILRRSLGHTKFSGAESTKGWEHNAIERPVAELDSDSFDTGGMNHVSFYPHPSHEIPHVAVHWTHHQRTPEYQALRDRGGKGNVPFQMYRQTHHRAYFTPEEAVQLADKFDPEQAEQIHDVLSHHFPELYRNG